MKSSLVLVSAFSLGATALLVSCSDSSGSKSPLAKIAVSNKTAGSFVAEKSEEFDYTSAKYPTLNLPEVPGCKIDSESPAEFDPRLKVGDKFVEYNSGKDLDNTTRSRVTAVITSVSSTLVEKDVEISDIVATNTPMSIPKNISQKVSCKRDPAVKNGADTCDTKWINWQPPADQPSEYCYGKSLETSDRKGTTELGEFKLSNGNVVKAKRVEDSQSVEIVCRTGDGPERSLGKGKEVSVSITTRGTVSPHTIKCYHVDVVYSYSALTLEDGTVVDSYVNETLEAPVR